MIVTYKIIFENTSSAVIALFVSGCTHVLCLAVLTIKSPDVLLESRFKNQYTTRKKNKAFKDDVEWSTINELIPDVSSNSSER